MPKKIAEETEAVETQAENTEETSVVETVAEAVTAAVDTVVETVAAGAAAVADAISGDEKPTANKGKRAERIGIVTSDKMTKTVVVIVDRKVKHPIYRKYVRKSKKFMAHDETGAKIGDRVRIIETRPLSARKRWRVVEIIQKAEL
jgi:small subunit ribosomal protein S17